MVRDAAGAATAGAVVEGVPGVEERRDEDLDLEPESELALASAGELGLGMDTSSVGSGGTSKS